MPTKLSRYCDGVMEACWLIALVVAPLFFNVYSSRVFEPDKIALVRSLALAAAAAWLIKLTLHRGAFPSLGAFFRQPLVAPVTAFMVIYLVATIFSITPVVSLMGSYQRMQGTFSTFAYIVIFGALAANLRQRAQAERILTTIIIASLPASAYGILQRYHLDSLPWGGDTATRVTSSMGNAIFIAAYLIMSAMITLGRVVTTFRAILTEPGSESLPRLIVRASIYVFILALNLITIWFSGSRGPWLGLLAGLFFFFVLLALHWRNWALGLVTIGLAAATGIFIFVFNIPNGPLVPLRSLPGLGRLGSMMEEIEGKSGTGRVRFLIWSGDVELMNPQQPGHPLQQPTGETDAWNFIRPLIGYGPEGLYVAFNRFYPPELGQIEARNASPDRSHNETFDAIVFSGLLGLITYLVLFIAIFYYALKWLGLVGTPLRRLVFLGLVLGGGALSAVGFVLWRGPALFGVGLPFGMLLGLIAFLTIYAVRAMAGSTTADASPQQVDPWRAIILISLFAAIVAHFTEIHFGIAIVSTRTHFWVFVGLLMVIGFIFPNTAAAPAEAAAPATAAGSRRKLRPGARSSGSLPTSAWSTASISAGLMLVVLTTLGFDFITNMSRAQDPLTVLVRALTIIKNPQSEEILSLGILGMFGLTWLLGGALAYLEEAEHSRAPASWGSLFTSLGLSFALSFIGWIILGVLHAAIATIQITSVTSLMQSADLQMGLLTFFYVEMTAILLGLAAMLVPDWPTSWAGPDGPTIPTTLAGIFLPLAVLLLSIFLNLNGIQADILYKTGMSLEDMGQPVAAIEVYKRVLNLAPAQDYYYLFYGRAHLSAAAAQTDANQRDLLLAQAESQLRHAQQLNPLNTDHSANLARIHSQWAVYAATPESRVQHARLSDTYYQEALSLSPHNIGLWNEWAKLYIQVLADPVTAQAKLDESFRLDSTYEPTYQLQGDLYMTQGRSITETVTQQTYYQKAITTYLAGIGWEKKHNGVNVMLHIGLAEAYENTQQLPLAIEQYLLVAQWKPSGVELWRVYARIASHYQTLGNLTETLSYGQQALDAAPDANKAEIQNWLNSLSQPQPTP